MADLPEIQATTPVVIPETVIPAQNYPDLFLTNMRINTDVNSPMLSTWAIARLMPYNYTTKQIMANGPVQEFNIGDLWGEAERVPLLAEIMGGMVQLISLLIQEQTLNNAIAQGATGLDAELAAVETALGITQPSSSSSDSSSSSSSSS